MPLNAWRCTVTTFPSFYDPLPADEASGLGFDELMAYVAGAPAVGPDKDKMPFAVPCGLSEAPLTPNMQAKTGRQIGKQRSSAHVTVAWFLVLDVDGLTDAAFSALLNKLRADGLSFLAYSTHSHGRPDKPGIRARLLIPVDRSLNAVEYAQAWRGFDAHYCGGAIGEADASGRHLWQQQGVWSAPPERVASAFRIAHRAGVSSADALIACAPVPPVREKADHGPVPMPPTLTAQRLEATLPWLNADDTPSWITALTAFKALAPAIGKDAARTLAVRYSEQGSEAAKAHNDDRRYDPAEFFDNVRPTMPPDAAMGTLCAMARDGAMAAVNGDRGKRRLSERGHQAAVYLARHHRRQFDELAKEAA